MPDFRCAGGDQFQPPSEVLAQPIPHAVDSVAEAGAELRERGLEVAIDNVEIRDIQSVTQQAGADCVCRARFTVIEAAKFKWAANPHGHAERFRRQFADTRNERAAADDDRALRPLGAGKASAVQAIAHGEQHFDHTRG